MNKHLNDKRVYKKIDLATVSSIYRTIGKRIDEAYNEWAIKAHIPHKLYEFIRQMPPEAKPCKAYILPKIHKKDLAGRLICPNTTWATLNLSKWLAAELNAKANTINSILKDSRQLIKELQHRRVTHRAKLLTSDVIALYPNISHAQAQDNIAFFFQNERNKSNCLRDLLDIVMCNNVLTFDNKYFKQIQGTAMGTPVAPPYANLFLAKLEIDSFAKISTQPIYFRRFIDDGLMIWDGPEEELNKFLHLMNTSYPSIKITHTPLSNTVDFLDLAITIDKTNRDAQGLCPIVFHNYEKPLNKYLYIPFGSYCPKYILAGFIKGRCITFAVNSTNEGDFKVAVDKFKMRLRNRGYPNKFINKASKGVSHQDRCRYLLDPAKKTNRNKLFLFTNYSPASAEMMDLKGIVHQAYDTHKPNLLEILPNCPGVGYLKGKTLRNVVS